VAGCPGGKSSGRLGGQVEERVTAVLVKGLGADVDETGQSLLLVGAVSLLVSGVEVGQEAGDQRSGLGAVDVAGMGAVGAAGGVDVAEGEVEQVAGLAGALDQAGELGVQTVEFGGFLAADGGEAGQEGRVVALAPPAGTWAGCEVIDKDAGEDRPPVLEVVEGGAHGEVGPGRRAESFLIPGFSTEKEHTLGALADCCAHGQSAYRLGFPSLL